MGEAGGVQKVLGSLRQDVLQASQQVVFTAEPKKCMYYSAFWIEKFPS